MTKQQRSDSAAISIIALIGGAILLAGQGFIWTLIPLAGVFFIFLFFNRLR